MDAREFIRVCINRSKNIKDEEENFDNKFLEDIHINHIYMNLLLSIQNIIYRLP